jgi:hypothetical protein
MILPPASLRVVRRPLVAFLLASGLAGLPVPAGAQLAVFQTIPSSEFSAAFGTPVTGSFVQGSPDMATSCVDSFCEFQASAELPHGSSFVGVEVSGCSDLLNDGELAFGLLRQPDNFAAVELVASGVLSKGEGCVFASALPASATVIDAFVNEYILVVAIGEPDIFCGQPLKPPCPPQQPRFKAVRVYYTAPASGLVVPMTPIPLG